MTDNKQNRFIPFLMAVCVVAGIAVGTFYAHHFSGNKLGIINTSSNKLNALLRIIDDQYVDTVRMSDLVEEAMPLILSELDPHSSYIPAKDLQAVNAELKGSFSGVGIQFTIQDDTVHVNSVIEGGPSGRTQNRERNDSRGQSRLRWRQYLRSDRRTADGVSASCHQRQNVGQKSRSRTQHE